MVVRGGTVVTPDGLLRTDIRIEGETIVAVEPELSGATEIDARGLHVFPAVIDVHLHFNEPGRTEWEGARDRQPRACGGRRRRLLRYAAQLDAVYGQLRASSTGSVPPLRLLPLRTSGSGAALLPAIWPEMAELADRGVVGFKAFLCDSGLPEFPRADDLTLWEGLVEAARLDLAIAVHAESHEITSQLAARGMASIQDFLGSRPVFAELEAIQRATLMAGEAKARLHIVHISSGRGVVAAAEARARGVDVSIETCPHYLFFTEEDVERLGSLAKCAPPLRSAGHRSELWNQLVSGTIDIVASDHSPAPPEMKTADFLRAWGGIAGVQSTLAVLLDRGHFERGIPLERIADLLAATPARRFRIPRKGTISPGNDADLALVDLTASFTLRAEDMAHRHRLSPYAGETFRGVVRRTIRRGETIFADGNFSSDSRGKLIRPK